MGQQEKLDLIREQFSQYFFAHLSTVFPQWADLNEAVQAAWEGLSAPEILQCQADLLQRVQTEHPSSKWPVSRTQQAQVGRWLQALCRSSGRDWPVHGQFEHWIESGAGTQEPNHIFKTYELGSGDRVVLLEENRDPLGQGTTGLISWQGACLLEAWFESFEAMLSDKRILELGSGLGLFGLSLLKRGVGSTFVFTDCHEKVLRFLRINLAMNFDPAWIEQRAITDTWIGDPPPEEASVGPSGPPEAAIQKLDWTQFEPADLPDVDVVVGSDLVYSLDLLPALTRVIRHLLAKSSAGSEARAYIACTLRSHEHMERFLACLSGQNLAYTQLCRRTFHPQENVLVHHEPFKPIVLYEIYLST